MWSWRIRGGSRTTIGAIMTKVTKGGFTSWTTVIADTVARTHIQLSTMTNVVDYVVVERTNVCALTKMQYRYEEHHLFARGLNLT